MWVRHAVFPTPFFEASTPRCPFPTPPWMDFSKIRSGLRFISSDFTILISPPDLPLTYKTITLTRLLQNLRPRYKKAEFHRLRDRLLKNYFCSCFFFSSNSFISSSEILCGTLSYFRNSMVNSAFPWVNDEVQ